MQHGEKAEHKCFTCNLFSHTSFTSCQTQCILFALLVCLFVFKIGSTLMWPLVPNNWFDFHASRTLCQYWFPARSNQKKMEIIYFWHTIRLILNRFLRLLINKVGADCIVGSKTNIWSNRTMMLDNCVSHTYQTEHKVCQWCEIVLPQQSCWCPPEFDPWPLTENGHVTSPSGKDAMHCRFSGVTVWETVLSRVLFLL